MRHAEIDNKVSNAVERYGTVRNGIERCGTVWNGMERYGTIETKAVQMP